MIKPQQRYKESVRMKTSAMHQQPTWNNYLTDNDYKLSKEELIKKKKLFVSKNNILIDFEEGIGSKKRYNGLHKTTKRQFASTSMLASSSGKLRKGKKEVILAQKSDDHDDSSVDCHDFNDDCEITALDMLIQGEDDLPHVNDFHETPERSSRRSYHAGGNSKSSVDTVKSNVVTDHGVSEVSLDRSYRTSHKGSIAKTIKNSGAHAPRQASYEPENQIQVDDLIAQVAHLTTEIQTYEQLVGKRSVFDVEDLEAITVALSEESSTKVPPSAAPLVSINMTRHVLNLVCKAMTYLLQSEVTIQQQSVDYANLSKKVDTLMQLTIPTGGTGTSLQASGGMGLAQASAAATTAPMRIAVPAVMGDAAVHVSDALTQDKNVDASYSTCANTIIESHILPSSSTTSSEEVGLDGDQKSHVLLGSHSAEQVNEVTSKSTFVVSEYTTPLAKGHVVSDTLGSGMGSVDTQVSPWTPGNNTNTATTTTPAANYLLSTPTAFSYSTGSAPASVAGTTDDVMNGLDCHYMLPNPPMDMEAAHEVPPPPPPVGVIAGTHHQHHPDGSVKHLLKQFHQASSPPVQRKGTKLSHTLVLPMPSPSKNTHIRSTTGGAGTAKKAVTPTCATTSGNGAARPLKKKTAQVSYDGTLGSF